MGGMDEMGGGGGESVRVIVRLRPEEQQGGALAGGKDLAGSCILCVDEKTLTVVDPRRRSSSGGGTGGTGTAGGAGITGEDQHQQAHDFSFDRVFGPEATQGDVFDTVKPLVHATVDGFTTTVFAYGSTGSGKTHTISGTDDEPGVLPQAVTLLFERLQSDMAAGSDKAFMVFLTYVEIYNNVFHNLLEGVHGTQESSSGSGQSNSTTTAATRRSKAPHNNSRFSSDIGGATLQTTPQTPPPPPPSAKIEVREHPSRGVFLSGGQGLRVPVSSAAAVAALVARGTKSRRTASTGLNDRSSRSHAILILEIEATHSPPSAAAAAAAAAAARAGGGGGGGGDGASRGALASSSPTAGVGGGGAGGLGAGRGVNRRFSGGRGGRRRSIVECVSIGKMQLIDLAGSERVSMSEVEGSSLVEAQNINLSLTLLGDVLSALSKYHRATTRSSSAAERRSGSAAAVAGGGGAGGGMDKPFVPYRNSKLTYLLKDSLGGNCKTLMICAVRAAPACFQQTMMSLRYAGRARDIKNVPHRVLEESAGGGGGGGGRGSNSGGGNRTSLRGTVDEIELLRTKLVETTTEFERLRGATATGESEKQALRDQLKALAEKNRSEKARMDELLEGVIHSQRGELEKRKAEFVDLQDTMDSHADTIEKQKERIRDLQTEREAAASAATTARDQAQELRQALERAENASVHLRDEASGLRARGEVLRIERDSATSRLSRLEEEGRAREAAREAEREEMATYRKAVKKMAKEREGLKAKAKEAEEKSNHAMAALADARKDAEEALVVAETREATFRSREAAAEERAAAAEGRARRWEKKADELGQALSQKVDEAEEASRAKAMIEAQREQALAVAGEFRDDIARREEAAAAAAAAASDLSESLDVERERASRAEAAVSTLRTELERGKGELSTLSETLALVQRQKVEVELGRELMETRKCEMDSALAAETARRERSEGRRQELERSAALLSEELQTLRASLSEASSGKDAAELARRQLSDELRSAEDRLAQATERVAALETSEGSLKTDLHRAGERIDALEASRGSLEADVERAAAREAELEASRDSARGAAGEAAEKIAAFEASERHLRGELDGAAARVAALEASRDSLKRELDEAGEKIATLEESEISLWEHLDAAGAKAAELEATGGSVRAELGLAIGRLAELEASDRLLREELEGAASTVTELEGSQGSLKEEAAGLAASVADLEASERSLKEELAGATARVAALEASEDSLKADAKAATEEAAARVACETSLRDEAEQAAAKLASLAASERFFKEELAKVNQKTGTIDSRLEESLAANGVLSEKLAMQEQQAEGFRESLVRQEAEMIARHAAELQAADDRAAQELGAARELHREKTAALEARLELQAVQAEREREHSSARHAGEVGELRALLIAREAEIVRSADEARSEREKLLVEEHRRELDEVRAKADELQEARDKQAAETALRETSALRQQAAVDQERWSSEVATVRAAAESAAVASAESHEQLQEELRALRSTLQLSSTSAEGLRAEIDQRDAEVVRLRAKLEEAARDAASSAREREQEKEAAAAREKEGLLEQRKMLRAEFEGQEAQAAKERQLAVRRAEQEADRRATQREKEVAERADEAREAEAATAKKQLRALSKRVVHLESTKKESDDAYERELARSKAKLVDLQQKCKEAEEAAAEAVAAAHDEAAKAVAIEKEAASEALRAAREEADRAKALLKQELDASLEEASALRDRFREAEARFGDASRDAAGVVETTREKLTLMSEQRSEFERREGALKRRVEGLQQEAAATVIRHKAALQEAGLALEEARADGLRNLQSEKEDAARREEELEERICALEAVVDALRRDLEDAVEDRDEAESSVQKRGDGARQRVLTLAAELREEKALTAKLRAASEKAVLDAEEVEVEITFLKAKAAALEGERKALEDELPHLRARLEEKDEECHRLTTAKKEAAKRLHEEAARGSGLEREVERLKSALHLSITTVQQHITSADPYSPAALLADPAAAFSAVSALGDGSTRSSYSGRGSGGAGSPADTIQTQQAKAEGASVGDASEAEAV